MAGVEQIIYANKIYSYFFIHFYFTITYIVISLLVLHVPRTDDGTIHESTEMIRGGASRRKAPLLHMKGTALGQQ